MLSISINGSITMIGPNNDLRISWRFDAGVVIEFASMINDYLCHGSYKEDGEDRGEWEFGEHGKYDYR